MSPERVGVAAWIALVALQFVWYFVIAPPVGGSPWIAIALTLPALLLPLLAWRSGVRRMLLWVGVVALFYFCHGVVAAWVVPSARVPGLLEVALCLALIGAIGWDTRQRKRVAARG